MGILSPAPAGSLGDQAMIDAAAGHLAAAYGVAIMVGPNATEIRTPARMPSDRRISTLRHSAEMVLRCRSMGLIGADILDGIYNPARVLRRLRLLEWGARLGCKTRVFGSSWSSAPAPDIIDFLRRSPWLDIHARDPISQARMERDLDRKIPLVADLAFLLEPRIDSAEARAAQAWLARKRQDGDMVLGVNLSGHTLEDAPEQGIAAYAGLIGRWLQADARRAVLMMPHDRRRGMVGDAAALDGLHQALRDRFPDRLLMLSTGLQAWELKALAGEVDLILSGRMHLAIAALGMATPVLCTVYQGKFEGLMQHFALDGLTMTPQDVLKGQGDDRLANVTARRDDLSARIAARLPAIREMSRQNFIGM